MSYKFIIKSLHTLSKAREKNKFIELLNKSGVLSAKPEIITPRDVSMLVYSFANLKIFDQYYWQTLENYYNLKKSQMDHQELTNCIWGFSKCKLPSSSPIWDSLEAGTRNAILHCSAREISTIAYAFASVGRHSPVLWDDLKKVFMSKIKEMSKTDLVLLTWAFSKVHITDPLIWELLEKNLGYQFSHLDPLSGSTVIYSFAKSGKGTPNLWNTFENAVLLRFDNYTSRSLANCVWAFSKMNRTNDKLWKLVNQKLKKELVNFNNIDAVNCIWAVYKANKIDPELRKVIETTFNSGNRISTMLHQDILNLAWALYHEGIFNAQIWDQIAMRAKAILPNVPYFHFKAHKCIFNVNTAYWDLFGNKTALSHVDKLLNNLHQKNPKVLEEITNIIDMGYFCVHMGQASQSFWNNLQKYLRGRSDYTQELGLLCQAKLAFIIATKFYDDPNLWKWDESFFTDEKKVEELMKDSKATVILLWALLRKGCPEKLLSHLEPRYKNFLSDDQEKSNMVITTQLMKNKAFNLKVSPKALHKECYNKLDKQSQNILVEAVFEDLFNTYLGRSYSPSPVYLAFVKDLKETSENLEQEHRIKMESKEDHSRSFSDDEQ